MEVDEREIVVHVVGQPWILNG